VSGFQSAPEAGQDSRAILRDAIDRTNCRIPELRSSTIEGPGEEDLAATQLLLLEDGHSLGDHALAAFRLDRDPPVGPVHAKSLSILVQMVRSGLGITRLPASAVPAELTDHGGFVVRRFRDPAPSRILGSLWRGGSTRARDFVALSPFFANDMQSRMDRVLQSL
jgi:LysR family hydrogen peroxide-inducible transcriptional activator